MGDEAASAPVFRAAATPWFDRCLSTRAPFSRAILLVASVEPSSTTIFSMKGPTVCLSRARRQRSIRASPLSDAMTTVRSHCIYLS